MSPIIRKTLNGILTGIGITAMLAGVATHTPGAIVIGLIVAAVNIRQFQSAHQS